MQGDSVRNAEIDRLIHLDDPLKGRIIGSKLELEAASIRL